MDEMVISFSPTATVAPETAAHLIRTGKAPSGMQVRGKLDLQYAAGGSQKRPRKPRPIALPDHLSVTSLDIRHHPNLRFLPPNLTCYELDASGTALQSLPTSLRVLFRLALSDCTHLTTLPPGLTVNTLILSGCTSLRMLPENLGVYFLNIAGCTAFAEWPQQGMPHLGRLDARGCTRLAALPPWLSSVAQLNLSGCVNLRELPPTLRIHAWIDIADTQITALPEAARGVQIHWKGVPISERVAFAPETITATEVLNERNTEVRRVLLERMGHEKFLSHANVQVIHADRDAGGERRLLRVPMRWDEDLVCLAVYCPSTGRQYMLRVPPTMRSCHQAAAWLAGYDNPADYRPLIET